MFVLGIEKTHWYLSFFVFRLAVFSNFVAASYAIISFGVKLSVTLNINLDYWYHLLVNCFTLLIIICWFMQHSRLTLVLLRDVKIVCNNHNLDLSNVRAKSYTGLTKK